MTIKKIGTTTNLNYGLLIGHKNKQFDNEITIDNIISTIT